MTYPPQQPGQPGQWGQQPDPYGQQPGQSPWGQQPDPYGQSPWGQQQPFPIGPPPPKKKGGLMAALIIVAILVIGGGGAGLYFLLSNDDKDPAGGGTTTEEGPRAAADSFTEELEKLANSQPKDLDAAPLEPYTCAEDFKQFDEDLEEVREFASTASNQPTSDSVELSVEDFKETDDGATFTLHRKSEDSEDDQKLTVVQESDKWVVCGLYEEDEPSSPPSTGGGGGNTDIPNPIPTT